MQKIVLATGNAGKVIEIKEILQNSLVELIPQTQLGIADIEETGLSFIENALLKARHAAHKSGLPALADDSGIVVNALKGAPGIYSARYAGEPVDMDANIDKLLAALEGITDRKARFHSVIVYLRHPLDPMPIICQGTWEGEILTKRQGTEGFGYDPIFYVPTHHCSAAELPPTEKNHLSHRGKALAQLKEYLRLT